MFCKVALNTDRADSLSSYIGNSICVIQMSWSFGTEMDVTTAGFWTQTPFKKKILKNSSGDKIRFNSYQL